jgi:tetratricopeptide (TPR) repeat protein
MLNCVRARGEIMPIIVIELVRIAQRLISNCRRWVLLALCFVTFYSFAQQPDTPPGEDLYIQGLNWMARNELQRARVLMERAVELNPNNAGARIDLSLIYCQLGEVRKANEMWDEIEARFSPPATLIAVMRQGRAQGCIVDKPQAEIDAEWIRGQSNNINQGVKNLSLDIPTASGSIPVQLLPQYGRMADGFTQFNGAIKSAAAEDELQTQLSVQLRENDSAKNLNILTAAIDVAKRYEVSSGRLDWVAGLGQANLGGATFQRHTKLRSNWRPNQQFFSDWDTSFGAGVSQINYPAFESMASQLWDVQANFMREWMGARLETYLQASKDLGQANRPGGNKNGTRWGFNLVKSMGPFQGQPVFAKLGFDGQTWRSASAYSPGFIDESRRQLMSTTFAAIVWPQTRTDHWSFEVRQQRNRENIKIFEYEAKTFQLSYRKIWGF